MSRDFRTINKTRKSIMQSDFKAKMWEQVLCFVCIVAHTFGQPFAHQKMFFMYIIPMKTYRSLSSDSALHSPQHCLSVSCSPFPSVYFSQSTFFFFFANAKLPPARDFTHSHSAQNAFPLVIHMAYSSTSSFQGLFLCNASFKHLN